MRPFGPDLLSQPTILNAAKKLNKFNFQTHTHGELENSTSLLDGRSLLRDEKITKTVNTDRDRSRSEESNNALNPLSSNVWFRKSLII